MLAFRRAVLPQPSQEPVQGVCRLGDMNELVQVCARYAGAQASATTTLTVKKSDPPFAVNLQEDADRAPNTQLNKQIIENSNLAGDAVIYMQ